MPVQCCSTDLGPRLVGDPVDTLTGAVFDRRLEFRLIGPLELRWFRHYDSSRNLQRFALGWGHTHDFDRALHFEGGGIRYEAPVGRSFGFPMLESDGDEVARGGFLLRRRSPRSYEIVEHGAPSMEFQRLHPQRPACLVRLFRDPHEILFNYNDLGRLIRINDSVGRVISVAEDPVGRTLTLTLEGKYGAPAMLLLGYRFDERGNLISTTNHLGRGYTFAYDHANRMLTRRGRMGYTFRFTYDEQGRCVGSEGDDGLYGVALDYKVPLRLTLVTRADGGLWAYYFDRSGALSRLLDPLGGIRKFIRDEAGQLILEVDPNENVTRFVYNAAGAPVARVDPLRHRIALPEDPNAPKPLDNRIAGNAAEYEYGRLVDVAAITLPGQQESLQLPAEVRDLIFVRHAHPDGAGSIYQVRPTGILWWPEPKAGRVFNDLGQLIEQRDEFGRQRRWSYDASGNVSSYADFDGSTWSYDHGSWHLLRGLTNPLKAEVRFTYSSSGEADSCVDAGGTRSEYGYDLNDNLVEVRRHGVVRETYKRDAAGNLVGKHASDGRELLRVQFGPGNLPVTRMLASGDEHTFRYDESGRPISASTRKDCVELAYDILGNLVLETRNGLGVTHRYQGWRRPAETVLFDRYSVRYEWRDRRTLLITDPGGASHEIRFLRKGLLERRFSNGSREFSQYDNLGRCLFKSAHQRADGTWMRRYYWSGEGDLLRVEDNRVRPIRHEYDAAHQLIQRQVGGGTEAYSLDGAGNLVAQPGLDQVVLLEGNRLKAVNGSDFLHNDRNHIASRQSSTSRVLYGYDSRDRLIRAEMPEGLWEAEYDALGRRTRKRWAGQATEYYWSGDQLLAEMNFDGSMRLYIYTDPLALTPLAFVDYVSVGAPVHSGQRYIIYSDQIGTPCLVEREDGTTAWCATIQPYGRAQIAATSAIQFHLRFPGHYFDAELGLHCTRFRHYDPALGRYLQSDPWGIAGGFNLYAYCPNPLGRVDVRGRGEGEQCAREQGQDSEGIGTDTAEPRRRMTDEELQSAADYVRFGGRDGPDDHSTLTVTEGMTDDGAVYTVTTSRGDGLTDGERGRAQEVFGADVATPNEGPIPSDGNGNFHSEQRGITATEGQTDRRQASSNRTMGEEGNFGAACSGCAACQRDNGVENVTGTVENGGRTNNPSTGAWRRWR